ncbi:MAG: HAD-IIIA family hydrolase [Syntrophales bacterium]|jgi:3-deoxy-D-manno-octulosonate 8-phosphate phosphatase (KDO 8-P phosphatase)
MKYFEQLDKDLIRRLEHVKLLLLDVDGVLTDGRIVMDNHGGEIKHFDVRDGHGLKMLIQLGIDVVLVTGRTSEIVVHRAKDLGIKEVHQGIWNKLGIFDDVLARRGLQPEEAAYIGDDIVDVPIMRRAGVSLTVADASEHVREFADYVARNRGGRGAVREICEMILMAKGLWRDIALRYELG